MGQPNENESTAVDDTVTDTAPLSAEDYEVPAADESDEQADADESDEPAEPAL